MVLIQTASDYFIHTNKRFLLEMKSASELDSRIITLAPTIVFMIGAFALIFKVFHRRTHRLTPLRIKFYRELGFHWTYFYLVRIWLLVMKIFKWASIKLNSHMEKSEFFKTYYYANIITGLLFLLLLFGCSLIPSIIVLLKHYMRHSIPDFLMWIGQDPWQRSEIGISGHYLDRPVTFTLPKRSEYAYRSKRSTSTEETMQKRIIIRNCKSMIAVKCVKSLEDLLR